MLSPTSCVRFVRGFSNKPFLSSKNSHFQNEANYKTTGCRGVICDGKFYCRTNELPLYEAVTNNSSSCALCQELSCESEFYRFTLSLALQQRLGWTRKRAIPFLLWLWQIDVSRQLRREQFNFYPWDGELQRGAAPTLFKIMNNILIDPRLWQVPLLWQTIAHRLFFLLVQFLKKKILNGCIFDSFSVFGLSFINSLYFFKTNTKHYIPLKGST